MLVKKKAKLKNYPSQVPVLIEKIRAELVKLNIDGFLIPSNDEFQSEYVPERLNRLKFISNFSGSNGLALITKSNAIFFTDGRYFLQAANELDPVFQIENIANLAENNFLHGVIGYDPKLHTKIFIDSLKNCSLVPCGNIVDSIRGEKVKHCRSEVFNYPVKFAGENTVSKLAKIHEFIHAKSLDALVISDSSNVCWLFNIRAHDVLYSPLLLSYAIIYADGSFKIFSGSYKHLPLSEFGLYLEQLANKKVLIDQSTASLWIQNHINNPVFGYDPCTLLKACKNNIEIKQASKIHILDGASLCKVLYWIQQSKYITEIDIVNKLLELRSIWKEFLYPSFASIVGFASNGAIIHYHPNSASNKLIQGRGLLLIDSGGQYFGGTTDVTRTISVGKPTYEQKLNFTLVLKGHIALSLIKFPKNTNGKDLDILARQFLWQNEKDYAHSTGHGVGNCLGVHETPPRIGRIISEVLKPGMIISNEPGYYKANEYGIRIENLMLVKEGKEFLSMKPLTLVPIEQKLIINDLLSQDEKKWLNQYHEEVYEKIAPLLSLDEQQWLKEQTEKIF